LVGGTAIALQIGHRRSIDFDLFSDQGFRNGAIIKEIEEIQKIDQIIVNRKEELTFLTNGVKFTFFQFPFKLEYEQNFDSYIKIPSLIVLGAMKAYALGQRAKWKDYVDLYFIIKQYHSIQEISEKATEIFDTKFNEKLLRSQLSYFEDVNYTEQVEFMPGFEVDDETVKKGLIEFSLAN